MSRIPLKISLGQGLCGSFSCSKRVAKNPISICRCALFSTRGWGGGGGGEGAGVEKGRGYLVRLYVFYAII